MSDNKKRNIETKRLRADELPYGKRFWLVPVFEVELPHAEVSPMWYLGEKDRCGRAIAAYEHSNIVISVFPDGCFATYEDARDALIARWERIRGKIDERIAQLKNQDPPRCLATEGEHDAQA